MDDSKFAKFIWFNYPHPKAPDFVKGKISIKRDEFMDWLTLQDVNEKGYVYLNVKQPKDSSKNPYMEINDYVKVDSQSTSSGQNKPTTEQLSDVAQADNSEEPDSDLPF
jgi:hypothetical protein